MGLDRELANAVAREAVKDRKALGRRLSLYRTLVVCLCVVLCIGFVCGTVIGIYAINRNYEYLESIVFETETIEVEVDSEGAGNAVYVNGDDNQTAGGDIGGQGKSQNDQA